MVKRIKIAFPRFLRNRTGNGFHIYDLMMYNPPVIIRLTKYFFDLGIFQEFASPNKCG